MRLILNITLFVLLINSKVLFAQQNIYKQYTSRDGLAHDITYQLYQDKNGYIWIGTDDGLSKFNGNTFKNYSYEDGLKSNYVIDITAGKNDEYLLSTWGSGIHVLKKDTIVSIGNSDKLNKIGKVFLCKNNAVSLHLKTRLKIIDLSNNIERYYVFQYEDNSIKLKKDPKINKSKALNLNLKVIDDTNYIFAADHDSHSYKIPKGIFTFNLDDLKPKPIFNNFFKELEVHDIVKTKENSFYVSSFNNIYVFKNNELKQTLTINLPDHKLSDLTITSDKIYFVGYNINNQKRSLFSYNLKTKSITDLFKLLNINSLPSDYLIDSFNNLWISTYGQGLYKIPDVDNCFFGNETLLNPDLKDIISYKNQIYFLSTSTLYKLEENGKISTLPLPFHTECFLTDHKNNLLNIISSFNNFTIENDFGITIKSSSAKAYYIKNQDLDIEFSSRKINFYKDNKLISSRLIHGQENYINTLKVIKDKIYVIYDRLGVYVFNKYNGKLLEVWNKAWGLHSNRIYDIVEKDNYFWLASNKGIIKIDSENNKTLLTTRNGLLSNHINSLYIDKNNVLWAGTHKGLNVLHDERFYTIDDDQGQKSSFITKIIEYNNYIYATGNNGLFKYENHTPFSPKTESNLLVSKNKTSFSVDFISFTNAMYRKIQYKLNDNTWQELKSSNIDFKDYKYGDYNITFRAKDAYSDWLYSEVHQFEIESAWYKKPYFFTLLFFVGLIIILLLFLKPFKIFKIKL